MTVTLAPARGTTPLPSPFVITDHLAVDVDGADFEAYCPGCGEGIGEVGAYRSVWVNLTALDHEVHTMFREHLRYGGGPDCRGE